jgi:benzodiazapine receptor
MAGFGCFLMAKKARRTGRSAVARAGVPGRKAGFSLKADLVPLAAWVGVCLLAGIIGSIFTVQNIPTWYASLAKPDFTPPNWAFGPVWTTLYVLMGVAAFLVWKKAGFRGEGKKALAAFGVQLALNAIWSIVFFGLQSPLYGLLAIVPLWLAIAGTAWLFWKIDARAGWLMVPYLAWVTVASALNYYVWLLN